MADLSKHIEDANRSVVDVIEVLHVDISGTSSTVRTGSVIFVNENENNEKRENNEFFNEN